MTRAERQAAERAAKRQSRIKPNKAVGLLGNILFGCLVVLLGTLIFFLVQSRLAGGPPTVAGYRMYVVLSGSMSPEFDTGSLVAVNQVDPATLSQGDIITFGRSDGSIVTHRIAGINTEGGLSFITKGDANNVEDSGTVAPERILGRVSVAIPYLGRVLVFSQSKQGLLMLIFIPALAILILEGRNLWQYACQLDREKAEKAAARKLAC